MSKKQQNLVDDWNEKHQVGQKVIVKLDNGHEVETVTTHEATLLSGHTAVGWFRDIRGCYKLTRAKAI